MKTILSLIFSAALALSMTGCASAEDAGWPALTAITTISASEPTDQRVYGQVTKVEGSKVTLLMGVYTQSEVHISNQTPPELPMDSDGQAGVSGDASENNRNGSHNHSQTPSDGDSNETPPDRPDGSEETGHRQKPDSQRDPGGRGSFQAGTETNTFDLSSANIFVEKGFEQMTGTMEDITVNAILELAMEENTVTSVTVKSSMDGKRGAPGSDLGGNFIQGTVTNSIDSDSAFSGLSNTSTGDDENALQADGASATLYGITVDKSAGRS